MGFIFATLETDGNWSRNASRDGLFPGSLQETHQPTTQTFLGVRHAFLPHFTRDEPLRTSAWEARNSPVSFGQLLASFFFMSLGQPQKSLRKLTCSVSFKFLKLEKIFQPLFEALSLDWVFLLQLVYFLLTDKLDQFVLDLMHKTQKLWRRGK